MEKNDSEKGFGPELSEWLHVLNRAVPGLSFLVRRTAFRDSGGSLILDVMFRERRLSSMCAMVAPDEVGMVGCLKGCLPGVRLYSETAPAVPVPLSRFLPEYSSLRELEMKLALRGVPA